MLTAAAVTEIPVVKDRALNLVDIIAEIFSYLAITSAVRPAVAYSLQQLQKDFTTTPREQVPSTRRLPVLSMDSQASSGQDQLIERVKQLPDRSSSHPQKQEEKHCRATPYVAVQ